MSKRSDFINFWSCFVLISLIILTAMVLLTLYLFDVQVYTIRSHELIDTKTGAFVLGGFGILFMGYLFAAYGKYRKLN